MSVENGGDYAGIGGPMATGIKDRGLAGAVIDTSIRDTPQIQKQQFPVFSRGIVPCTMAGHYRFAGVNVPETGAGVPALFEDIVGAGLGHHNHAVFPPFPSLSSKEAVAGFGRI